MFCVNCGHEVDWWARQCWNCKQPPVTKANAAAPQRGYTMRDRLTFWLCIAFILAVGPYVLIETLRSYGRRAGASAPWAAFLWFVIVGMLLQGHGACSRWSCDG